ncbi:hypothetical protein VTO42DRAFT_4757 [Malbranchea cinnamomea]
MPESAYYSRERRGSSHRSRRHHDERSRRRSTRSRSPHRHGRSPSPRRDRSRRRERGRTPESTEPTEPVTLPFDATPLLKRDLQRYRPMFGMYLDIQKHIDIEDLDERELKGRWKSFIKKWNRGELAEGWYDPVTLEKAQRNITYYSDTFPSEDSRSRTSSIHGDQWRESRATSRPSERTESPERDKNTEERMEEDEGYGPQLPSEQLRRLTDQKSGPTIPTMQDLQLRREEEQASLEAAREAQRLAYKQARTSHKSELRALEDEIAPRADPGTRERQLEKRRERAASNREFAESRRGGSPGPAIPDSELMGGDDLEAFKKAREKEMRKKNEREIRKEEILRARAAEREAKLKSYRRKEEQTMEYLRALAKQRFG